MGVDYVQGRSCRVKRDLGVDVLVSRLKARGQAALLVKRLARDGNDPMTETITRVVQYPSGPVAEQVSVGDLLKMGKTLEPYMPLCEGCTANFRQTDFGCCGFLNYPIARAEEEWLLSRLPADISSVAGVYLRSVLTRISHKFRIPLRLSGRKGSWSRFFKFSEVFFPIYRRAGTPPPTPQILIAPACGFIAAFAPGSGAPASYAERGRR